MNINQISNEYLRFSNVKTIMKPVAASSSSDISDELPVSGAYLLYWARESTTQKLSIGFNNVPPSSGGVDTLNPGYFDNPIYINKLILTNNDSATHYFSIVIGWN